MHHIDIIKCYHQIKNHDSNVLSFIEYKKQLVSNSYYLVDKELEVIEAKEDYYKEPIKEPKVKLYIDPY